MWIAGYKSFPPSGAFREQKKFQLLFLSFQRGDIDEQRDFRPRILIDSFYKIISGALADRLKLVLPMWLS